MMPFLIVLADDSDEKKFSFLYEKYFYALLAFAKSIVKSDALAEEVVQESYKRLLKNLHKVNISDCIKTKAFLVKVVRNVAYDFYKKELKFEVLDIDELGDTLSSDGFDPTWDIFDAQALSTDLKSWILRLSAKEQMLLRYKVLEDWSYREIESVFGIKESTASSIVSRAKKKLLAIYKKERGTNENGEAKPKRRRL